MGKLGLPVLFAVITVAFGAIALDAFSAHRWVIAIAAAGLAFWMGSFAWSGLRRFRR
ncbi:MAG: hypothetical protein F2663_06400 [Actinobacteria bacterium]|uniref:Unannotated protein n=1 Tax=freshwater metagenome TaxID=449393 RepID=A0A6J6PNQ1_9ZZZZ|nr:hypothetical protein [Actinomycetota bacterium]